MAGDGKGWIFVALSRCIYLVLKLDQMRVQKRYQSEKVADADHILKLCMCVFLSPDLEDWKEDLLSIRKDVEWNRHCFFRKFKNVLRTVNCLI